MLIYKNSEMLAAITEYVHHPRYREVLRLRFCESCTYEEIGEIVGYTPDHVKHLCKKYKTFLMSCIYP